MLVLEENEKDPGTYEWLRYDTDARVAGFRASGMRMWVGSICFLFRWFGFCGIFYM